MKVLHIATTDFGGAAQGMLNLHYALSIQGIESKILVAKKTTNLDFVYQMEPNINLFIWSKNKLYRRIQYSIRKRGKLRTITEYWNEKINKVSIPNQSICFTSPFSQYDITQHPFFKETDILHLHWVGNFLDYPSFFKKINKPVVWTLRDENPGLGGFHYTTDKVDYYSYYADIEEAFWEAKRKALILQNNITLIGLSNTMTSFCSNVEYLASKKIFKIYNPIDNTKFSCIDHQMAKKVLNIDDSVFVVSFVSISLKDHRKGLPQLLEAVKEFSKPIKLLCVGNNDYFTKENSNINCYGVIDNPQLLSIIYSASDVFVTPSLIESFGKTTIEAMLCGAPVVSTKTGIAAEIINEDCGVLIDSNKPISILNALNLITQRQFNRHCIKKRVQTLFNPESIAKEHIKIYNTLLPTRGH